MKKLKLFSLLMLLFVGVTSMWGEASSFTINFNDNGTDASTALTTSTFLNQVSSGAGKDSIKSVSATSYCYPGTGGLKISSNNNNGSFTLILQHSLTIDSVVLNVKNKNATTSSVTIGSTAFSTTDGFSTSNFVNMKYKGTQTSSNSIAVAIGGSSNKARVGYLASMTIYHTISGAGSTDPTVTVDPSPIAFGDVKQYAEGPLGTPYVFKNFTITGENLEHSITVAAPSSAIFDLWNVATESIIGSSIELTPDANGAVDTVLAIMAATSWSGPQNSSITISGDDLDEDSIVNITMNVTPRYAVDVEVNDDEMGTATINGGSVAYVEDDSEQLTLVATPKAGYEFVNWTYDDNKVLLAADDEASTTAYAYEEVTITANFQAMSCTSLAAPTLNKLTKSYDYANLKWTEVTNADKYLVNIVKHEGSVPHITNLLTPDLETDILNLEANTQYDYTVMAVGDGTDFCDENNPLLEGNFTTDDYPAATLTLSENGETRTWGSDLKVASVIALPTAVAAGQEVAGKVLVGYTNEANKTYSHDTDAPTVLYAPGANYTIADTEDKLYAVYAIASGDPANTINIKYTGSTTTMPDGENSAALVGLDASSWKVVSHKNSANTVGLNTNGTIRLYYNANGNTALGFKAPKTIDSIRVTISQGTMTLEVGGTSIAAINGAYPIGTDTFLIRNAATSNVQLHITNIAAIFNANYEYSNYTTTGVKAPSATPASTSVALEAAAVADGSIAVEYANVALANVKVATFSNAACTDTLNEGWLAASLTAETKQIAYTAEAAVSYVNTRSAYIQLVAPSPTDGVAADTVVITVSQAANPSRVFASLEALAASDVPANDSVTVTLKDDVIKSFYYYNSNLSGVYFNVQKAVGDNDPADVKIYFNSTTTISDWEVNGSLSGELRAQWTTYKTEWQLKPKSGFAWADLSYKDPTATGVDNTDANVKAVKVMREGQIFILRGDKTYTIQGQLVK